MRIELKDLVDSPSGRLLAAVGFSVLIMVLTVWSNLIVIWWSCRRLVREGGKKLTKVRRLITIGEITIKAKEKPPSGSR